MASELRLCLRQLANSDSECDESLIAYNTAWKILADRRPWVLTGGLRLIIVVTSSVWVQTNTITQVTTTIPLTMIQATYWTTSPTVRMLGAPQPSDTKAQAPSSHHQCVGGYITTSIQPEDMIAGHTYPSC